MQYRTAGFAQECGNHVSFRRGINYALSSLCNAEFNAHRGRKFDSMEVGTHVHSLKLS